MARENHFTAADSDVETSYAGTVSINGLDAGGEAREVHRSLDVCQIFDLL